MGVAVMPNLVSGNPRRRGHEARARYRWYGPGMQNVLLTLYLSNRRIRRDNPTSAPNSPRDM